MEDVEDVEDVGIDQCARITCEREKTRDGDGANRYAGRVGRRWAWLFSDV